VQDCGCVEESAGHAHGHGHGHAHDGDIDFEDHGHGHAHSHGGAPADKTAAAAAALEAARSAPEEEHAHDDADHGAAVKREPICVQCTGHATTDGGNVEYIFDVLQGGVAQSGSLTPVGGTKVGEVRRRYSEFDALKQSLTKIFGELAALNDKFPKKHLYGNSSDSTIQERRSGLENWMNYVLRTPTAAIAESAELSEFLMPITADDSKPAKFALIFSTGNIAWVDKLLSADCSYTFAHKHLLSDDMHSHTAYGKADVLGQLSKTSRSWGDVRITSTEEVQPGVYKNVYQYVRLMTQWECVETVTTDASGFITGIARNRT
jgi:hypothetical protein